MLLVLSDDQAQSQQSAGHPAARRGDLADPLDLIVAAREDLASIREALQKIGPDWAGALAFRDDLRTLILDQIAGVGARLAELTALVDDSAQREADRQLIADARREAAIARGETGTEREENFRRVYRRRA